jgi:hypothetical protein
MDGADYILYGVYNVPQKIESAAIESNLLENKLIELSPDGIARCTDSGRERADRWNERVYAAEKFGIPVEHVRWYHSGCNYDRIGVTTKQSADAVTKSVSGQYVNGGMLEGMPLGGQTKYDWGYDVTC